MRKLLCLILLVAAFSMAQTASTSIAIRLTSSESLTKDECVFLSEIIRDAANANVPSDVKVIKGKKTPSNYYVESKVSKMGSKYHIMVELYKTEGKQLLNSYSNRTSDVDQLTDGLEAAMSGFFGDVVALGTEPVQEPAEVPTPVEEAVDTTDVVEVAENTEPAEEFSEEPAEEPAIKLDLSNIQYFDNGKSGILAPTGATDPGYDEYEKFVWSSVATSGIEGGAGGGSGGKSDGMPAWVKVLPSVIGVGLIGFGMYENAQIKDERKKYDEATSSAAAVEYWDNLKSYQSTRNALYAVGGILVGFGLVLTVAF